MDIAALSMAMSQNNIMESVGVAMLSKSLDTQEMVGSEVLQLLDGEVVLLIQCIPDETSVVANKFDVHNTNTLI